MERSRLAQRQADKWLISGSILIGTAALGIFGLPLFLRGVWLLRRGQRDGLSVRPMLVTLLGYLVIIDAAINAVGWALDMVANHTLLARVLLTGWGNMFDAGYFWRFNELWIGGAAGPGEKGWEIGLIFTVFTMRIAAAIGFLQMKRWGHQWMIITCWMGVVIWCAYVFNMTMYADVRFAGVVLPVIGWWLSGTWARYASDGDGDGIADPQNLYDSTLAAARYLCSGGLNLRDPSQVMTAILRYNNSIPYARNVLGWAAAYATGVVPIDLPPVTGPAPALGDPHLEHAAGLGPGLPLNIHGLPPTDPLAQAPLIDLGPSPMSPQQPIGPSQSFASEPHGCTVICIGPQDPPPQQKSPAHPNMGPPTLAPPG
jgi:hypothetical protein